MSEVLIVGLVGLYLWYLLAKATLFDRVFAYPREHWGPLWDCPWCAGFWLTGLVILISSWFTGYDWRTHLAAAAVVGVLGSHSG